MAGNLDRGSRGEKCFIEAHEIFTMSYESGGGGQAALDF